MAVLELNSRIWLEKNGKPYLGHGRITLLENIDQQGSINKAAKAMGMSYRRAWQLVTSINEMSEEPVVIRNTGGSGGGGTQLTEKGKMIIKEFHRIELRFRSLLKEEEQKCCI